MRGYEIFLTFPLAMSFASLSLFRVFCCQTLQEIVRYQFTSHVHHHVNAILLSIRRWWQFEFTRQTWQTEIFGFCSVIEKRNTIKQWNWIRLQWAITEYSIWTHIRSVSTILLDFFIYPFQRNTIYTSIKCYQPNYNLDTIPPAATIVSPVIYAASSEAKNATTPAIFSDSPNLLKNSKLLLNQRKIIKKNLLFHWHMGKQMISSFFRFIHRQSEFRFDHTGCNAIDANIFSGQFLAERFCQPKQSSFTHRICANILLIEKENPENFYSKRTFASLLPPMDWIPRTTTSIWCCHPSFGAAWSMQLPSPEGT